MHHYPLPPSIGVWDLILILLLLLVNSSALNQLSPSQLAVVTQGLAPPACVSSVSCLAHTL